MRNYGIDLLKLFAMLGVVMLHVLGRGGVVSASISEGLFSVKYLVLYWLYAFVYPAVNVFVLSTGYVMWNRKWRLSRLVELWIEVVFYSVISVLVVDLSCPKLDVACIDYI